MNLLSNKNKSIFFLKKENNNINTKDKISLILSSEFYWLREFTIPVNSKRAALEVLPSLFEDILPKDNYTYQIIKKNKNKFLCFAFINNDIFETIKTLDISLSQVEAVYFAQNEFTAYESFTISQEQYAYTNDILVKVPPSIKLNDCESLDNKLNDIKLSKNKVDLNLYKNIFSKKYLYIILFFLSVVSVLNALKYITYSNEISINQDLGTNLKREYKLPRTLIQMKSYIKNYDKKITKSLDLRKQIEYIISYKKYSKDMVFESLILKKTFFVLVVKNVDEDKFNNFVSKKYQVLNSQKVDKNVRMEIKL